MMRTRKLTLTGLVVLAGLFVLPAAALAGTGYAYQSQLTGFAGPFGVAFDSSGNVYVANSGAAVVDKFNSAGVPINFSGSAAYISASKLTGTPTGAGGGAVVPFTSPQGVAVDASGNIYVTDTYAAAVDVFNAAGVYQRQLTGVTFSEPFGVTVDRSTGDVYVAGGGVVDVFNSADVYQSQFGSGTLVNYRDLSVAVNEATGEVYVADSRTDVVYVFNSSGVLQATWTGGGSGAGSGTPAGSFGGSFVFVAVEQSSGHVFVVDNESGVIDVFDSSGTYLAQVSGKRTPRGSFRELYGVAITAAGDLYAIDGLAGVVDVFARGATPEAPITEAASVETGNTATLHGELNPSNKESAGWYFAYNTGGSCAGGATTPVEPEAEVQAVKEEKQVTGLEPEQQYTVCVVAENTFGSTYGAPVTLTTPKAPPLVIAESTSEVKAFTASIDAQINPNKQTLYPCEIEYGTDPTLTTNTAIPCEPEFFSGFGNQPESKPVQGLEADTTYYYRVIGWTYPTAAEKAEGAIQSFKTVGPPQPSTGEAQDITRVTAALSGTVDPERGPGTYHFVYIDQAGYEAALAKGAENPYAEGGTTTQGAVPAGEAAQAVQPLPAEGLLPETTYHYALVASDEAGTVIGNDMTFTTGAATPPIVATGGASAITMSTATLSGTLDTLGLDVSYAFEVSTDPTNYGAPTGAGAVGAGPTEASVSTALQGLQPGTTYYYRLIATNTDGTTYGTGQAFTTPGFPPPLSLPATPPLVASPQVAFPAEEKESSTTTPKRLTNAQKLAKALQACNKKVKSKRAACRASARKKYGPVKTKKKAKGKKGA